MNNHQAGHLATGHLLSLGHRRIGYIGGATATFSRQERFAGYRRALSEAGIDFDPSLVSIGTAAGGYDDTNAAEHGRAAAEVLLGHQRPIASRSQRQHAMALARQSATANFAWLSTFRWPG